MHDNWLDPDAQNRSARNGRDPTSLLPGKQRFRLNYKKQWKQEQSPAQQRGPDSSDRSLVMMRNAHNKLETMPSQIGRENLLKNYASRSTNRSKCNHKKLQKNVKKSGEKQSNRSGQIDKKRFKDDSDDLQ